MIWKATQRLQSTALINLTVSFHPKENQYSVTQIHTIITYISVIIPFPIPIRHLVTSCLTCGHTAIIAKTATSTHHVLKLKLVPALFQLRMTDISWKLLQSISCGWSGLVCVYLMTPGLNKDIQCHVWPYFFISLQITRSDIRQHTKRAVSLVIFAYGNFNLPQGFVWICMG